MMNEIVDSEEDIPECPVTFNKGNIRGDPLLKNLGKLSYRHEMAEGTSSQRIQTFSGHSIP